MKFKDHKVRVVLQKGFKEDPVIIIRGTVIDENENGILISGRIFMKVIDEARVLEKPIDDETKLFYIPFTSMRFLEFIVPGSRFEELHKRILREPPLPSAQINREGAF
jgi:hypothetical protein